MKKVLIILGPTAVGKTSFAVKIAQKYQGEIISADSRQVYKRMDILTGKDLPVNSKLKTQNSKLGINNSQFSVGYRLKDDIPVWMTDVVSPQYSFSAGEYSHIAKKVITLIHTKKKLPIIVGGTGFYIKSLIDPAETLKIPPNTQLRKRLNQLDKIQLQDKLMKVNPIRLVNMNNSDKNNSRRLIRAIEVAIYNKKIQKKIHKKKENDQTLCIGLYMPYEELFKRIDSRIEKRLEIGVIQEVNELRLFQYNPKSPGLSATGYKYLCEYLKGNLNKAALLAKWKIQEHNLAKKQMVWFKKQKNIYWYDITIKSDSQKLEELLYKWYTFKQ